VLWYGADASIVVLIGFFMVPMQLPESVGFTTVFAGVLVMLLLCYIVMIPLST